MRFIGVDPGCPVWLALVNSEGGLIDWTVPKLVLDTKAKKPKNSAIKISKIIRDWVGWGNLSNEPTLVYCEAVSIRQGEGVVSGLKYAGSFYLIEGICAGLKVNFNSVHPRTWKKSSDKAKSVETAIFTWPHLAAHFKHLKSHNIAEAALLARWARDQHLQHLEK